MLTIPTKVPGDPLEAAEVNALVNEVNAHEANHNNPHEVKKWQVGLGNVPNVDATKRANHTGTQPAVSISDFVESVRALLSAAGGVLAYDPATGTLSVQAVPVFAGDVFSAGPGEFGSQVENGDRLVKRSELVNYLNKWSWKQLVKGATQVNVNLAGPAPGTVDGIAFGPGRWLVRAQTNAAENGIYTYSSAGGWVRAAEADTWGELINATVFVSQGTNSHDKLYTCTVDEGGTLGTDPIAWQMIGAATTFQFGAGFTVTGNNVTVDAAALKSILGLGSGAYLSVPAAAGAAAAAAELVRGDDPRLAAVATNTTAIAANAATLALYDPTFAAVVPSAGTATIACASKFVVNVTLALSANTTLAFSGLVSGATGTVLVTHDNTSTAYSLTLPSGSRGSVLLSQVANAVTELSWVYATGNLYWTSKAY